MMSMRFDKGRFGSRSGTLALLAGVLYFVLAASTIHLTSNGHDIATIWPANAVLLALLLRSEPDRWAAVLVAGFLGNAAAGLATRGSVFGPVLYGSFNLVEVLIAAVALRRALKLSSPIGAPDTLGQFILWAGVIAPSVSGIGGAATANLVFGEPFAKAFQTWFLSDALGLLIFTPFCLSVFGGDYVRCFREKTAWQRLEVAGLHVITAAVAFGVFFSSHMPLLFALFPPVIVISFRVGRLGTQVSVILIAVIGAVATMRNLGPVALFSADPAGQAGYFQFFLAVLLLSCLPMSAGLSARSSLTDELADRERSLIQANATLQSFSANAAHDLRSPLATFVSALSLVKRDKASTLSEKASTYIDMVIESATSLAATISALLIASKATDTRTSLALVRCDLNALLAEAQFNLTDAIERSRAVVQIARMPCIEAEPNLFRQLFQNLIENSIKYRSNDRTPEVHVKHQMIDDRHVFSVEDNGVGIGTIAAKHVFHRYEQEKGNGINGVGIGLALCANIVGLHGGSIAIDANHAVGCRVVFDVPSVSSRVSSLPQAA